MVVSLLKRGPLSQRSEPREHVHTRAQIASGESAIECLIRDVSKRGARLVLDAGVVIPSQFELVWSGGHRRLVTVRWRRKNEIGVAFVERRAFGRRG